MTLRRPTPSRALIPSVGRRASGVGSFPLASRHATRDTRQSATEREKGMTLVEVGMVMGIVSLLLALVLGLARHLNAITQISRAQADLGEWHESMNRWFLQFGEYPHARIDTTASDNPTELLLSPSATINGTTYSDARANLTLITNRCEVCLGSATNITFRSFLTAAPNTVDPWGTPYVYSPSGNAQSYVLFSCGPNRQSTDIPVGSAPATSLDDIHLER